MTTKSITFSTRDPEARFNWDAVDMAAFVKYLGGRCRNDGIELEIVDGDHCSTDEEDRIVGKYLKDWCRAL